MGKQGINDGEVERIRIYMDKKMNFVDDYIEEYSPKIISQLLGEDYEDNRCTDIVAKVSHKVFLLFIKSITKEKNYTTFIIEP